MAGLTGLKAAVEEQKAKQAAFKDGQGAFARFIKFTPNVTYVVRFLEQGEDVQWAWVHDLPKEQGKNFSGVTPCLNQDGRGSACPGCEMGIKRKIQGWINVIVRDAPLYKKDGNGRIEKNPMTGAMTVIGQEDQVFVWNSGSRLFDLLGNKDRAFKGLMSRDFEVVRTGEGLSTAYSIEPADVDAGPQAMSKNDQKIAAEKNDPRRFTTPESYEVAKLLLQGVPRSAINDESAPQQNSANLFLPQS